MFQPVYFLKVVNHYCNFLLKVNDIILYKENENGNISTSFPLNEVLNADVNIATLEVLPMKGEPLLNTRATIEILVEMAPADGLNLREKILESKTPNFAAFSEEGKLVPPSYHWELPLKISLPFKDLNLYKLTKIVPDKKLMDDLLAAQLEMYLLFQKKKLENIIYNFQLRSEDKARVRYQDMKKTLQDVTQNLASTFNDNSNELLELNLEEFTMQTEYGGKLFSLIDKFGDPPIIYYNESLDMSIRYPMKFGLIWGKKSISIIR